MVYMRNEWIGFEQTNTYHDTMKNKSAHGSLRCDAAPWWCRKEPTPLRSTGVATSMSITRRATTARRGTGLRRVRRIEFSNTPCLCGKNVMSLRSSRRVLSWGDNAAAFAKTLQPASFKTLHMQTLQPASFLKLYICKLYNLQVFKTLHM